MVNRPCGAADARGRFARTWLEKETDMKWFMIYAAGFALSCGMAGPQPAAQIAGDFARFLYEQMPVTANPMD